MTDVAEIRAQMRKRRRELDPAQQKKDSDAVCAAVTAHSAYVCARCVMAYMACAGEVALDPVLRDVLASGRTLVLPRCDAPGMMTARRIDTLLSLAPGRYGIMEPGADCRIVDPMDIDLILAPGTAFDVCCRRIGQGGGYYDRFLLKTRAFVIGVCHDFALLGQIPSMAHDRPVDAVITPLRMIERRADGAE